MRVEYAPGAAWAVIRGERLLVLPASASAAEARKAFDALGGEGVDANSFASDAAGFGSPLAVVLADSGWQVLRRSGVPAAVDGQQLERRAASLLAADPVDGDVLSVGQLELLDAYTLPVDGGVVRVGAVRVSDVAAAAPVEDSVPSADTIRPVTAEIPIVEPEPTPEPEPEPTPEPSATPAPSGPIIDSVPGFRRVEPEQQPAPAPLPQSAAEPASTPAPVSTPAPAPASAPQLGDHDGSTVRAQDARGLVERLRAQRAAEQAAGHTAPRPAHDPNAVLVLSTVCAQGHVNPPTLPQCFICGSQVVPDSLEQRPRPQFAVAQLSDGRRIQLDSGVVFGRRPRARSTEAGSPQLIVVESPNEDISRSHVELRIEEWNVVVEDLGSTNGTVLERNGQPPQRLRGSAPAFAYIGDRIDLGEGVVIEVVAP